MCLLLQVPWATMIPADGGSATSAAGSPKLFRAFSRKPAWKIGSRLHKLLSAFGSSATSQQYFSLRNQSYNQSIVLFSKNKSASDINHQPYEHAGVSAERRSPARSMDQSVRAAEQTQQPVSPLSPCQEKRNGRRRRTNRHRRLATELPCPAVHVRHASRMNCC